MLASLNLKVTLDGDFICHSPLLSLPCPLPDFSQHGVHSPLLYLLVVCTLPSILSSHNMVHTLFLRRGVASGGRVPGSDGAVLDSRGVGGLCVAGVGVGGARGSV